jgi:hypothetical protein
MFVDGLRAGGDSLAQAPGTPPDDFREQAAGCGRWPPMPAVVQNFPTPEQPLVAVAVGCNEPTVLPPLRLIRNAVST